MDAIISRTGQVVENFHLLGHQGNPVFLLDGPRPVLFDAGFSCLTSFYLRDARAVLGRRCPELLLLTHSHFDHCGGAAGFLDEFPGLKVMAAPKAQAVLARPNALKLIGELNQAAAEVMAQATGGRTGNQPFKPFAVEGVVDGGDEIELGPDLSVRVLATPGHTWDSLSYYIPQKKILIAGEALGTGLAGGSITTEFLVDYQAYVDSIERLSKLEVEVLCQGHHQIYLGKYAHDFFGQSLASARKFKDWVLELLEQEGGQVERVMQLVKAVEYDSRSGPRQPLPAYLLNLRARVKHLAKVGGYQRESD
jgi:2-aminobenzoylacetyl-CoA thioesterase